MFGLNKGWRCDIFDLFINDKNLFSKSIEKSIFFSSSGYSLFDVNNQYTIQGLLNSYYVGSKECHLLSFKELFLTGIMQPPEV